ncbi:MAG: class I SAM-dependent methyltransferase [Thermoanaerobaculia bacterium]
MSLPREEIESDVPSRLDWSTVRSSFVEAVRSEFAAWISPGQPHFSSQLAFAIGRFAEGSALVRFFELTPSESGPVTDVLDIGSGNGGVAFAFANCLKYQVHALDVVPNRLLARLQQSLEMPVRPVIGTGSALPYRDKRFDIVLLVDVIEHVKDAHRIGAEVMRVLRPGGVCFVSTAARLRYLTKPDPHYGVKGLVALPNALQRFVVNHILRRRILTADGRCWPAYDVEHTFWHVNEIARLFPGHDSAQGLYAYPMCGGRVFTREWLRRRLRGFLFHHVLIRKGLATPAGS